MQGRRRYGFYLVRRLDCDCASSPRFRLALNLVHAELGQCRPDGLVDVNNVLWDRADAINRMAMTLTIRKLLVDAVTASQFGLAIVFMQY